MIASFSLLARSTCRIVTTATNKHRQQPSSYQQNTPVTPTLAKADVLYRSMPPTAILLLVQILLVAVAAGAEIPSFTGVPEGGWQLIELRKEDVARLTTALRNEYNYRATVKARVCLFSLDVLYEQTFAAGTNYQYHGLACQIDNVTDAGLCPNQLHTYDLCNMYDIRVFEPKGTVNASQVLMIDYTLTDVPKDTRDVLNSSLPASSEPPRTTTPSQTPEPSSTRDSSSRGGGIAFIQSPSPAPSSAPLVKHQLSDSAAAQLAHHAFTFAVASMSIAAAT